MYPTFLSELFSPDSSYPSRQTQTDPSRSILPPSVVWKGYVQLCFRSNSKMIFHKSSGGRGMLPETGIGVYRIAFYHIEKEQKEKGKFYDDSRQY